MNWQMMFWEKCREISKLRKEIKLLQTILHSYLPIIGDKGNIDEHINN